MSDTADAPQPTNQSGVPRGEYKDAKKDEKDENHPQNDEKTAFFVGQKSAKFEQRDWPQGRAVIINDLKAANSEVDKYEGLLTEHGFSIGEDLNSLTKAEVKEFEQSVALIVRKETGNTSLNDALKSLKNCKAKQKLLVHCRVVKSLDEADKNSYDPVEFQSQNPNLYLLDVICTKDNACKFLEGLRNTLENQWPKQSIRDLDFRQLKELCVRFKIGDELTSEFCLQFQARPDKLLRNSSVVTKANGDAKHLMQLEAGVLDNEVELNGGKAEDLFKDLVYQNRASSHRKALIINNVVFDESGHRRSGSMTDCQDMYDLLRRLQYQVEVKLNLDDDGLIGAVTNFADDKHHGDSCILVIMSHGSFGKISCVNGKEVEESKLLELMYQGENIRAKPRLLIIQACRKEKPGESGADGGAEKQDTRAEDAREIGNEYYKHPKDKVLQVPEPEPPNNQTGLIVAHSTSPSDFSFRNDSGSRFIRMFCAACYKFAHKLDVVSMITTVNFYMTHGLPNPKTKDAKLHQQQLPWWSVQTDKKFFLVSEEKLTEMPENTSEEVDPRNSDREH